jgi:hypothetical protein
MILSEKFQNYYFKKKVAKQKNQLLFIFISLL